MSDCRFFRLKFGGQRGRNENEYRLVCFSAKMHQDFCLKRFIYPNCLLFTTRRNIYKVCIGTSPGELSDFRTFRKLRRSTSKRKKISTKLFQRWKVSGQFFQTDYLPQLSAAHNTSKYWRTLYSHVARRNVRFSDFSPSSAIDVVKTKRGIVYIF